MKQESHRHCYLDGGDKDEKQSFSKTLHGKNNQALSGCASDGRNALWSLRLRKVAGYGSSGEMDITGLYEGTTTVTAAKNDTLGEVNPLEFRIVQNDNGTATLLRDGISVDGTYNPETGEFSLDYGFTWNLVFSREGDTIVAKGTMTSNETGEGYTQEITLELKRTGD